MTKDCGLLITDPEALEVDAGGTDPGAGGGGMLA